jgi:hypothetical protein
LSGTHTLEDSMQASPRRLVTRIAALTAMASSLTVLGAFVVSDLALAGERVAVERFADDPPPREIKRAKVVPTALETKKPAPKPKRRAKAVEFGSFEGY